MSLRALDVIVVQRDPAEQQVAGMSVVAALSFGLGHVTHQHPLGVGASMIDATELERECACDVTQLGRKFRVDDIVAQQLFHLVEVALPCALSPGSSSPPCTYWPSRNGGRGPRAAPAPAGSPGRLASAGHPGAVAPRVPATRQRRSRWPSRRTRSRRQQCRVGRICRRMPAPYRRQLGVYGLGHVKMDQRVGGGRCARRICGQPKRVRRARIMERPRPAHERRPPQRQSFLGGSGGVPRARAGLVVPEQAHARIDVVRPLLQPTFERGRIVGRERGALLDQTFDLPRHAHGRQFNAADDFSPSRTRSVSARRRSRPGPAAASSRCRCSCKPWASRR